MGPSSAGFAAACALHLELRSTGIEAARFAIDVLMPFYSKTTTDSVESIG